MCAYPFAQKMTAVFPHLALTWFSLGPWGLEDPDSRQTWNYADGGGAGGEAAQPGEGTVAVKGPQGPPAQDPPLLSSAGPVSAHLSQK